MKLFSRSGAGRDKPVPMLTDGNKAKKIFRRWTYLFLNLLTINPISRITNERGVFMHNTEEEEEKVILIGIDQVNDEYDAESSLDELYDLAKTAGAKCVGRMIQKRDGVHRAHYFGKGKLEELREYIKETGATGIICDDELTANQMRNMEKILETKIMNRTLLILDIFAARAHSAEGKVQVELAQLKYSLSHLTGQGKSLSRLGGGIGTRGPGEKKLETDRRNISDRISELNRELKEIEKHRKVLREKRIKNKIPVIALAGYTNAGKSTLMNTVTNAGVLEEDKLFATLDTTTRKVKLPSGAEYLFTDTVGFIQKLPHNLIKAFKSTLEEVKYADVILHIVDSSNFSRERHMKVVYETLNELGCEEKPIITVFNKIDKEEAVFPLPKDPRALTSQSISAKKQMGISELLEKVEDTVKSFKKRVEVLIPYDKGSMVNFIHGNCEIVSSENTDEGFYFKIYVDNEGYNRLQRFCLK